MFEIDSAEHERALRRRDVCRARLAKYVREGRDYVVVLAHENRFDGTKPSDNPAYVQFALREDLRLQVEVQGDHYRGQPYSEPQQRMLRRLGTFATGCSFATPKDVNPTPSPSSSWIRCGRSSGCTSTTHRRVSRLAYPTGDSNGWCRLVSETSKVRFFESSGRRHYADLATRRTSPP